MLMRSLLGSDQEIFRALMTNGVTYLIVVLFGMSIISIVYTVWFLSQRGATPGMQLMKLRLEHPDGSLLPWKYVVFRQFIGQQVSGVIFWLGFWVMTADEQQRAWHDRFVNSVVSFEEKRLQRGFLLVFLLWGVNFFFLYVTFQAALQIFA
jgi:uncharacterized RDD family membrane protein YckC